MGGPGSGGHNRKSVETHLTRGTFRADRHAKVVNLPTSAPPPAPPGLSATAQARWTQLVSEFAGWTEHEYVLLEMALFAGDRAAACRARISREGLIIVAGKGKGRGSRRQHPLLRVQRDAERTMLDCFRALRLGR